MRRIKLVSSHPAPQKIGPGLLGMLLASTNFWFHFCLWPFLVLGSMLQIRVFVHVLFKV